MLTIDDLGKRKPYTYKEIEEIDYPDYWNVPTEPNIAGLMESEEDNKTVRMY